MVNLLIAAYIGRHGRRRHLPDACIVPSAGIVETLNLFAL